MKSSAAKGGAKAMTVGKATKEKAEQTEAGKKYGSMSAEEKGMAAVVGSAVLTAATFVPGSVGKAARATSKGVKIANTVKTVEKASGGALSGAAKEATTEATEAREMPFQIVAQGPPGSKMVFEAEGQQFEAVVPPGVAPGQTFVVNVMIPGKKAGDPKAALTNGFDKMKLSAEKKFGQTDAGKKVKQAQQVRKVQKDLGLSDKQALQGVKLLAKVAK